MKEERERLRQDILDFLKTVKPDLTREDVVRTFELVKESAHQTDNVDVSDRFHNDILAMQFRKYLAQVSSLEHNKFYPAIASHFSPKYYPVIKGFIQRYEAIEDAEYREIEAQENRVIDALEVQRELYKDDYNYGDVPGEVIIYPNCIQVSVFGYREGFKDSIPRGGKYQGKGTGTWEYPNTEHYRKIFGNDMYNGCPVLVHPDCK